MSILYVTHQTPSVSQGGIRIEFPALSILEGTSQTVEFRLRKCLVPFSIQPLNTGAMDHLDEGIRNFPQVATTG